MNPHFRDMLAALCAEKAEFLIVGAYALAAHGVPRATGDIDIWVRPTAENSQRVWRALERFRAPLSQLDVNELTRPNIVFQMGLPPNRIDLLTSITAVEFDSAWQRRKVVRLAELDVPVLGRDDMVRNKRAAGRPKDLADAAWLESEPTID